MPSHFLLLDNRIENEFLIRQSISPNALSPIYLLPSYHQNDERITFLNLSTPNLSDEDYSNAVSFF